MDLSKYSIPLSELPKQTKKTLDKEIKISVDQPISAVKFMLRMKFTSTKRSYLMPQGLISSNR